MAGESVCSSFTIVIAVESLYYTIFVDNIYRRHSKARPSVFSVSIVWYVYLTLVMAIYLTLCYDTPRYTMVPFYVSKSTELESHIDVYSNIKIVILLTPISMNHCLWPGIATINYKFTALHIT